LAATRSKKMKFQIIILLTAILTNCTPTEKRNKSMTTELDTISYNDLLDKSYDYLTEQQDICRDKYKLSTYQNWFYDQETGELTFSDNGIKKLIIKYEDVGSVSLKSNTWLWSWANETTEDIVKSQIGLVKEFGEKRQFEKLTSKQWTAEEVDGWEMTSISAYLLKAKGAYRVKTNNDSLFQFMIFKEIIWADSLTN
jgi:hypothetical protein